MSGDHNADQKDSSFLDKPEALILADHIERFVLADSSGNLVSPFTNAAAELRRLHEENQQYSEMCANQARSLFEMHKTQVELLEALEDLAEDFRQDINSEFATHKSQDPGGSHPSYLKARAAIRKARGGTE